MKIALILTDRPAEPWKQHLLVHYPELDIHSWPDLPSPDDYQAAVVWKLPQGLLSQFKKLELICCIGAGVDHLLPDIPPRVRLTRVADRQLAMSMSHYIIMAVLNFQRSFHQYHTFQQEQRWQKAEPVEKAISIGLLGLGELGRETARQLSLLGFQVHGWSRSEKKLEGMQTYAGDQGLKDMLPRVNVLVCLLPLTSQTEDILSLSLFRLLPAGSLLINVARGGHLVEEDLIRALEEGWLSAAVLDVFRQEPLPAEHPFWQHPQITITPHVASVTDPASAARQVAENLKRFAEGQPLLYEVVPSKEY
ncbi:MAG: 2-hydroxyacid dehydrogenase [Cyclobacteriaceae bacterium]